MTSPTVPTQARRSQRVGPMPRCPIHRVPLDGGPVRYRCSHGHAVAAADVNVEYTPRNPR